MHYLEAAEKDAEFQAELPACRNRHCPKCQGSRTAAWLQREASWLLPVDYYHVVFTLPPAVAAVVWQNQRVGYTLLFQAAQQIKNAPGQQHAHQECETNPRRVDKSCVVAKPIHVS